MIDAYTGQQHDFPLDGARYPCSTCRFVFTRDGTEVALAIPNRDGGEAHEYVKQVQLFSARTGKPTRTLKITVMPTSPFAWSPDGTKLIGLADGLLRTSAQLVDLTTGRVTQLPENAVWADAKTLLAVGRGSVTTLRQDGTVVRVVELDEPLMGHYLLSIGPGR